MGCIDSPGVAKKNPETVKANRIIKMRFIAVLLF
jgi:hypothetical protein